MAERNSEGAKRGFAGMDPVRQRQIASEGGRAAHHKGTAHEFTPDEARAAGRKGGEAVSRNRQHMAEIGREGGRSAQSRRDATIREAAARELSTETASISQGLPGGA